MSADRTLQRIWYERAPFVLFLLLVPLSVLFGVVAGLRRAAYRAGLLRPVRIERPVLVIGNVSVGGTGKTPLVIWIADYLASRGCKVGIVTRGYGGRAETWPRDVSRESSTEEVGDEAVLLASRTSAVVVAGPDRVAAAQRAARTADVILSDDGLQHYRLARDAEIVVLDAQRAFGNGWLLPAGPLRERAPRVNEADLVVQSIRGDRSRQALPRSVGAMHELADAINLRTGERRPLQAFSASKVHAVAGIGHPEAFFAMLKHCGLTIDAHALPDHAAMKIADITFDDGAPVLMTEKDAVKCRAFANELHWGVPLTVRFSEADERMLTTVLDKLLELSTDMSADSRSRRGRP
jgi:tetraacyldisaccharide 4'-kinase